MKRIYNRIIAAIIGLASGVERFKTWFFEWLAIFRKRKLYKDVKWTKEQKKTFKAYWKQHYGKKISNRWHRLYESFNGRFCIQYIPELLYSTKIEPRINNRSYMTVFSDKCMNKVLYDGKVEGVRTPITYLTCDAFSFTDGNGSVLNKEEAIRRLNDVGQVVIKPTVGSSSGHNVRILNLKNGIDTKTGEPIGEILNKYKKNYIIQEKVTAHPDFAALYGHAINTIRLITYKSANGICNAPICMRIGSGGAEVDNIHSGGMCVGVSDEGVLMAKAYRLGYGDNKEYYTVHPDTNIRFEGYRIPLIPQMREAACRLHGLTPNAGMISWDFTVNDQNETVIIEANYTGQSVWFPQIINEKPMFGDNTDYVLSTIKNKGVK